MQKQQKKIIIYSSTFCPYCTMAFNLLKSKNLNFEKINISTDSKQLEIMLQKSNGARSVPQIFIGNTHVGGYDDMQALEQADKLDKIIYG